MLPVLARVPELDSIPVIVKAMLELTELSTVNESPEFSVRLAIRQVEFVAVQVPESGAVWHDAWSFKSIVVIAWASGGKKAKTVISMTNIGMI